MMSGALVTILFADADPKRPQVIVALAGVATISARGFMQETLSYGRISMDSATELTQGGKARLNFSCEMVVHWEME
jgi:hypothetical protein